jgi:hypothetical protein
MIAYPWLLEGGQSVLLLIQASFATTKNNNILRWVSVLTPTPCPGTHGLYKNGEQSRVVSGRKRNGEALS